MFSRKVISYLVMLVVIVLLGTIVITNLSTHSAVNMTGRQIVRLETPVIEPSLQVELSAETVVPTPTWPPDLPTGIAPTDVAQQAAFTKASNRGTVAVTIDGINYGTINQCSTSGTQWQASQSFTGLTSDVHIIHVARVGTSSGCTDGYIDVDKLVPQAS